MPRSLLSVAQAEKLIGKKKFNDEFNGLVTKPLGKPTLAPAEDKRPAIDPSALDGFEDLTKATREQEKAA